MRYYWRDSIPYEVVNPDVDACWQLPEEAYSRRPDNRFQIGRRSMFLRTMRLLFSQNRRNKKLDVLKLLRCPTCAQEGDVQRRDDSVICTTCGAVYEFRNGVPRMFAQS